MKNEKKFECDLFLDEDDYVLWEMGDFLRRNFLVFTNQKPLEVQEK